MKYKITKPYDISASVGDNGENFEFDVATIQELLTGVSPDNGGPAYIKVDGKCGPKTKEAIQRFQLKHFGWKLADARVDPNGPTHNKLRFFVGLNEAKGTIFQFRRTEKDSEVVPPEEPLLFEVFEYVHKRRALYAFSTRPIVQATLRTKNYRFEGSPFTIKLGKERDVTDLSGNAVLRTDDFDPGAPWPSMSTTKFASSMTLFVYGLLARFETVYASPPFRVVGSPRYGRLEYIREYPAQLGRW